MKNQILFVHGGHAYSTYEEYLKVLKTTPIENIFSEPPTRWHQMLRTTLGNGYAVCTPQMPNKQNAVYEEWKIWFERHIELCNDDVILIGHSLGGIFLAKYVSETHFLVKISSLHLVAPVATFEGRRATGTTSFSFDFSQLYSQAKLIKNIHIYHSVDDSVVPYSHALQYHEILPHSKLHTFENRGHFLQDVFPELIQEIRDSNI